MEFLSDLWMPIILNTIVLFFASFIAWTVLPHHFGDWKKLDSEKDFMDTVKRLNIKPGYYMFPQANSKAEQNGPEHMARYERGPRGILTVFAVADIKANLIKTVVFFFVTTAIIGYITHIACPPGATGVDFMKVFRISGSIGLLTHAFSGMLSAIWFKRRLIMDFIDGIVYGLIIGLIFAWLWPMS